jgi:hypothetical protein
MRINNKDLWGGLHAIGSEDGTADTLLPAVVAKLIELKIVELGPTGLPQLTPYGERAYVVMESGEGSIPEIEALDDADIEWPPAIATNERLPLSSSLVFAWKPIINGWDIVPGRKVHEFPQQYTYWLPMMPKPD